MANKTPVEELTEEEKFEMQLQQEQELARLMRTYTIMVRNRAEFAGGRGKLAKQKKVLDIFKTEQVNILTDLAVASTKERIKEDQKKSDKLSLILAEYDAYDEEIKIENNHLKEIDDQIQMVKKKVLDLAAQQITDDKYQERIMKAEQMCQTLENKLEVQIKKFCAICWDNRRLREEINHLLIERADFNKIWDKLITNLCIGKKFMLDLIEQATIAYDQREEWVQKLQFLRQKAHNDLLLHVQEMRELQRKKDHDAKLQEFFSTKGQKRIMKDLCSRELKKREIMREKIEKQLEEYWELLIQIKDFSGEDCIQAIAKHFLEEEERNFALFRYVNDLNSEMEGLADRLGELHIEIDQQKVLNDIRKEEQGNRLEKLTGELADITAVATGKENEVAQLDKELGMIINGINTLFKMFRCNNDPLIKLLGHNENINYFNVLLYLEILEKNIQEAFVTVFHKEKKQLEHKKIKPEQTTVAEHVVSKSIEPIEKIVKTSPCPLCIEHELVSDVIDTLQYAATKEEIQVKLAERLEIEGSDAGLHNVSACHLPKSRQIIQKRYQ